MDKDPNNRHPALLLIGAPGSGKGTQGKILGTIPRFFHCACGEVFRSLDTRTSLGQEFVRYSSRGELVPDELTIKLWEAQIESWIDTYYYKPDIDIMLLDGIPRNVRQAEMLESYLEVHQVFHLTCPNREELARRMRKRALKENRYDDASDAVIQRRIETYEAETRPILEFYPAELITQIDATQQPIEVVRDIITRIVGLDIYKRMSRTTV